jgi:hypothetical protein
MIDDDDIRRCYELSNLTINSGDRESLRSKLSTVFDYFSLLEEIDGSDEEIESGGCSVPEEFFKNGEGGGDFVGNREIVIPKR